MIKIDLTCTKTDKILNIISTQITGLSYSNANKALRKKDIRINNKRITENVLVYVGEKITIFLPDDYKDSITEDKFFDIFYEDDNIVIVNKNKGIEVMSSTENLTVEQFLTKKYKIYPLNTLDRNTEGLVIFSKSKKVLEKMKKAMKNNEIEQFYMAEVVGIPKWNHFTAIGYYLKDEKQKEIKIFDTPNKGTKQIVTELSVLSRSTGGTSIFIIKNKNARINQIRAHIAYVGHPIIGDGKYGKKEENKKFKSKTQKLTASKFVFNFTDSDLTYLNNQNIEITPSWINN